MIAGILVILLGLAAATVPFWAGAVDPQLGMGDVGTLEWTTARLIRHIAPGVAIIVGGVMLLPRATVSRVIGAVLALAGAVWVTVVRDVLGRLNAETMPETVVIARRLIHHTGLGALIITVVAAALGWTLGTVRERRRAPAPAAPAPTPMTPVEESERESVGERG